MGNIQGKWNYSRSGSIIKEIRYVIKVHPYVPHSLLAPTTKDDTYVQCHIQYTCRRETLLRLCKARDQDLVSLPIHDLLNARNFLCFKRGPQLSGVEELGCCHCKD